MAKIETVQKSRKEITCSKCGKVIPVGSSYKKCEPYGVAPIKRCISCGIKNWETSGSNYSRSVGQIVEEWEEIYALDDAIEDIMSDLENIKDECESSLDNMPDGLRDGDTGCTLQERIDGLENAISELDLIDADGLKEDAMAELEVIYLDGDEENEDEDNIVDPSEVDYDEFVEDDRISQDIRDEVAANYADNLKDAINEVLESIEY